MGECGLTQVKLGFNAWSPSWHLAFADRAAVEMPTREEVNDIKDLIECFLSTQAPDRRIGWTFLIKTIPLVKKKYTLHKMFAQFKTFQNGKRSCTTCYEQPMILFSGVSKVGFYAKWY